MNVLVTGAKGFLGKNLVKTLKNISESKDKSYDIKEKINIFEYDIDTPATLLNEYCAKTDFVFHLAGVNRPKDEEEFMKGNFGFTLLLLETLEKHKNKCTVMLSSSIQAELNNLYGNSKRAGEKLLFDYGNRTGAKVLVYRFPNIFGKWCRPNYNSVVATFCYNIARGLPIKINDPNVSLTLVYIDDVVNELINALYGAVNILNGYCRVPKTYNVQLGKIAELIYSFKNMRKTLEVPHLDFEFEKKLYSTYLSYLPENDFSYPLKMNIDNRGSFTELIKTVDRGQFSVNIIKPHVVKGQHWHHTKNEKFVVVSGEGVIRFRSVVDEHDVVEYYVSGNKMEIVDIPVGYTHNIENCGDTEMIVFMWCNEIFNPQKPDTYSENV